MLPYGLILLVASVALALHHVAMTDAPRRSKMAVFIIVAASLVIWWNYTQWQWRVLVMVLQVTISVYALAHFKAHSRDP